MRSRLHVTTDPRCRLTYTNVLITDTSSTLSRSSVMNRAQTARPAAAPLRARSRFQRLSTGARVFTPLTTARDHALKTETLPAASLNPGPTLARGLSLVQALSPNRSHQSPTPLHPQAPRRKVKRQTVVAAGAGSRTAVLPTLTVQAVTPISFISHSENSGPGITCAP